MPLAAEKTPRRENSWPRLNRPPALLNGDSPLQQPLGKVLEADSHSENSPDLPAQLLLVRFKLGGRLTLGGVLGVQSKLPFLPRPILPFGDTVFAPAQQVDLVQPRLLAQLHDLGPEVAHSGGGASVLGPGLGVAGLLCIHYSGTDL